MRLAVPKENTLGETRVAIVPDTIKRLSPRKSKSASSPAPGNTRSPADDDYRAVGATIESSTDELFTAADVVVQIHPPTLAQIGKLRDGYDAHQFAVSAHQRRSGAAPSPSARSRRSRPT